jgi:hypothetical protein
VSDDEMGVAAAFGVAFLGAAVAVVVISAAIAWGAVSFAAEAVEAVTRRVR